MFARAAEPEADAQEKAIAELLQGHSTNSAGVGERFPLPFVRRLSRPSGVAVVCVAALTTLLTARSHGQRGLTKAPQAADSVVLARADRQQFKLIKSGLCGDSSWSQITDVDVCEAAADKLELDSASITVTTLVGVPDGCFYRSGSADANGTLWMGTSPLNRGNREYQPSHSTEITQPVCMQAIAATFTKEQAEADASQQVLTAVSELMFGKPDAVGNVTTDEATHAHGAEGATSGGTSETTKVGKSSSSERSTTLRASTSATHEANKSTSTSRSTTTVATSTTSTVRTTTTTTTIVLPTSAAVKPVEITKAIGYAPLPLKGGGETVPDDDFMQPNTSVLWGPKGRQDLKILRSLGANAVRLYGNDPSLDHSEFLEEARKENLQVIAGMSDFAYTQMYGACKYTDFDCYKQIKEQYLGNLKRGFLQENGQYHQSLGVVVLINEPDLKLGEDSGRVSSPDKFCKAIVSAFDAVLDAEKEARARGPAPNFTATFSYGVCYECTGIDITMPAYGQMRELRKAMQNPSSVGYTARNNLWGAYNERFVNSVNTENRAEDYQQFFQYRYDAEFQGTPVFIGEYHAPPFNQKEDLQAIVKVVQNRSSLLTGLSFFEFQIRYDKGGVGEMSFGMFGLGSTLLDKVNIKSKEFEVYCLTPTRGGSNNDVIHQVLTEAFNGTGVEKELFCTDTPADMI